MSEDRDDVRVFLARIDERVSILDKRVDRIERKLDELTECLLKKNNHWKERGIVMGLVTVIIGLVELLKRVV